VGRVLGITAALAGLCALVGAAMGDTADVGAMAAVKRTVYGVPPQGTQLVKREGDSVAFQEEIETMDSSGALIRFVDDSTLTLGAKSKVLIDSFVFDPAKVEGNALIRISVGTLRFVTGEMPKGKTVIKTPTATLVLRGTDVTVHVHPDGTTDATVHDGSVDAHNDVTSDDAALASGQGATFGLDGNSDFSGSEGPSGSSFGGGDATDPPEHRRSGSPAPQNESESGSGGGGGGYGPSN
jgi:hypothetical protein